MNGNTNMDGIRFIHNINKITGNLKLWIRGLKCNSITYRTTMHNTSRRPKTTMYIYRHTRIYLGYGKGPFRSLTIKRMNQISSKYPNNINFCSYRWDDVLTGGKEDDTGDE